MTFVNSPLPSSLAKRFPVLIIAHVASDTMVEQSAEAIRDALKKNDIQVTLASSLEQGETAIGTSASYSCIILSWGLCIGAGADKEAEAALRIIRPARRRSAGIPILLARSKASSVPVPLKIMEEVDGLIWMPEDSPEFIAGRIQAAAKRYLDSILPPFFGALVNFNEAHEYSWHTPGHTGGTAFMKTAVGLTFLDFYGEQMLRSDLSVAPFLASEVGSLNDHSGPVDEAERHAARVFGADQTFFTVGGTSASNEIVLRSAVTDGDVVLVDRNCHKSLNYALNLSGAIPVYMQPQRNARGLIGPVPRSEMTAEVIRDKVKSSPLVNDKTVRPVLAALTNSTYDGLCYNVRVATTELSKSVPRIHYDEAWYAYARFNPIYDERYGMHRGDWKVDDNTTVTAVQSTHKLLAALSQASMIHIRSGKNAPVKRDLFNEAFMMHTSTSPQYSIIASNDVSAKMMADAGEYLTDECIGEAVDFRQAMVRIRREIAARSKDDWWFGVWQPDQVDGVSFADVEPERLRTDSKAWVLEPGAAWHGFQHLDDDYCMLDPIKVTVLTPGLEGNGDSKISGIPAPLVSLFLYSRGIVVEKTEPYSFLLLFSMGVTRGKWGSMIAGLMEFKRSYDSNEPLVQVLPNLVNSYPERYQSMGLKDLATEMHEETVTRNKEASLLKKMSDAFEKLPDPVWSPRETYGKLVKGNLEQVEVADMVGRVVAVQLVPYPPGIPLMMPGEKATNAVVDYLNALQRLDNRFPGFEHDTHGITLKDKGDKRVYCTYCVKAS